MKAHWSIIVALSFTPIAVFADYPGCPASDVSGLEAWRDSAIRSRDWDVSKSNHKDVDRSRADYAANVAYNAEIDAKNAALRARNKALLSTFDTCFPSGTPACLKRVFRYVEAQTSSGLPENPPEDDLYRELPEEFRSSKNKADKFRMFTKTSSGVEDLEAYAKRKGWLTVRYKSRFSGGFDQATTSLLMIQIPGDSFIPPLDYDRYVNIALPADPEDTVKNAPWESINPVPRMPIPTDSDYKHGGDLPYTTTMVTVKKATADTKARVFFTKFRRVSAKSSDFAVVKDSPLINQTGFCYQCHPNGLRAISPVGYQVRQEEIDRHQVLPDSQWDAVRKMNNAMLMNNGFKTVDFGREKLANGKSAPVVDPEAYGATLGATLPLSANSPTDIPTRTEKYILADAGTGKGCAYAKDEVKVDDVFKLYRHVGSQGSFKFQRGMPVDWKKVANAMNCGSCHNNVNRGALNKNLDFGMIEFKILGDQSMPVGAHHSPLDRGTGHSDPKDTLNPNERIALVNCLEAEFEGEKKLLDKWFKAVSCQSVSVADPRSGGVNSSVVSKPDSVAAPGSANGTGAAPPSTNGN